MPASSASASSARRLHVTNDKRKTTIKASDEKGKTPIGLCFSRDKSYRRETGAEPQTGYERILFGD